MILWIGMTGTNCATAVRPPPPHHEPDCGPVSECHKESTTHCPPAVEPCQSREQTKLNRLEAAFRAEFKFNPDAQNIANHDGALAASIKNLQAAHTKDQTALDTAKVTEAKARAAFDAGSSEEARLQVQLDGRRKLRTLVALSIPVHIKGLDDFISKQHHELTQLISVKQAQLAALVAKAGSASALEVALLRKEIEVLQRILIPNQPLTPQVCKDTTATPEAVHCSLADLRSPLQGILATVDTTITDAVSLLTKQTESVVRLRAALDAATKITETSSKQLTATKDQHDAAKLRLAKLRELRDGLIAQRTALQKCSASCTIKIEEVCKVVEGACR